MAGSNIFQPRMNTRKVFCLICFFVLLPLTGRAQQDMGTSAGLFLSIEPDARGMALGGAVSAMVNDASACYWNPAVLPFLDEFSMAVTHCEWLGSLQYEFFGASRNVRHVGGFGLHMIYMSESGLLEKDISLENSGRRIYYENFSAGISYGRSFGRMFSAGLTGRYIQQNLVLKTSYSFSGDAGLLLKIKRFQWALTARNFGPEIRFVDHADPLNYHAGTGVSYVPILKYGLLYSVGMSAGAQYDRTAGLVLDAGVEPRFSFYSDDLNLFFRSGVKIPHADSLFALRAGTLAFGAGLAYKNMGIDYALRPFGELGNIHYITLNIKFVFI